MNFSIKSLLLGGLAVISSGAFAAPSLKIYEVQKRQDLQGWIAL